MTWKQRPGRGESRKESKGKLLARTQKGIGVALALCHTKLSGPSMRSAPDLSIRLPSLPRSPGHSTHVSVQASRPHHPPQEAWHAVGVRGVGFQTTRPCAAPPPWHSGEARLQCCIPCSEHLRTRRVLFTLLPGGKAASSSMCSFTHLLLNKVY